MDELGNITIKIYLVKAHYRKIDERRRARRPNKEVTLYDGAIHEATKKICDHRVTYVVGASYPDEISPNVLYEAWVCHSLLSVVLG